LADGKRLAVVTTGRQDYGLLRATLLLLRDDPRFALEVWVGGMHLSERYGKTVEEVRRDGLPITRELDFLGDREDPTTETAAAMTLFGAALREDRPQALVLIGDRTETLAAAVAATAGLVPIVHIHGGEETEGAVDNACRHAITKLSHLHLVSHPRYASRVIQMGEDPDSVIVVGAPGVDNLYRSDLPSREEIERAIGHMLPDPVVLVTMHPATLGQPPMEEVAAVAEAMERVPATYLITSPNSDAGGRELKEFWERWTEGRDNAVLVDSLGSARYWSVLRFAAAVLGNSSSGIIEAPAAGAPVVNVGDRQRGRLRFGSIRDVPARAEVIERALREALSEGRSEAGTAGYPAGPAAPRIVEALARWKVPTPPRKRFHVVGE
jgi:UDP-N-acetylglucosamine 2-epimerase (non-hydrolysing)/GDP/UDP-N,N'-diacetylbacillosamine 2-epimerase (hydrolysing)